jgi:UDPglucose 6-dehydrogenase
MSKIIYVVGAGYVGLATGIVLAKEHPVVLIERDVIKVDKINRGISPIEEQDLKDALKHQKDRLQAISELSSIQDGSVVFAALPTNYDEAQAQFDTTILDSVIEELVKKRPNCLIVIKSTVPIGYTQRIRDRLSSNNIYFSPEFLREGRSFQDITKPDRIIVSPESVDANHIMNLLSSVASIEPSKCILTDCSTAEAVKLFSNTYLAMRVAYFNEVDTFSKIKGLNSKDLLTGMCLDQRIGMFYNNPSFGFGGYCFPKDTKQTQNEVINLPIALPDAIVKANELRIKFLTDDIVKSCEGKRLGMYRLSMKSGSDNIRSSSSMSLLKELANAGLGVVLYEPLVNQDDFLAQDQIIVADEIRTFISKVDIIIANRPDAEILDSGLEIYSRNIFNEN